MAAIIIGGIGYGAVKIQEALYKKKAKKAQQEWELEHQKEKKRQAVLKAEHGAERRSDEAREDRWLGEASWLRSRSSSAEGRRIVDGVGGEDAPPSYDEAIGTSTTVGDRGSVGHTHQARA